MRLFTHVAALAITSLALATPALATLPIGAKAPDFSTQGALAGKPFPVDAHGIGMPLTLSGALKKGLVVLYFYPKTFTSGCTIEAHNFAEASAEFNKLGATVIGVSADTIEDISRFSATECRNKFAVAVATPQMIKAYDAKLGIPGFGDRSNRTSYVIAPDGTVIYAFSALAADGHVKNTLDAVRKYRETHKKG